MAMNSRRVPVVRSDLIVFATLAFAVPMFAQPSLPSLSIDDVSMSEDTCQGKSFVFTVILSHLGKAPVTVRYATSDGISGGSGTAAAAGKDYAASSGVL